MAFPTTKVTFSTKVASETISESHVNDLQTVVEALEDKVGIDSSAVASSHDYLLTHLPTQSQNWDAGAVEVRAETFESDVVTGTAPLTVASTTVVTNLNADTVDGTHLAGLQTVLTNSAGLAAAVNDETGTGVVVFNNAPTLIAPVLGVATATSVNGLTIDTTTGTLDITNAKTLTVTGDATISATPYTPGGTDVAVADGGTGSGTAAGARSNLGAAASGANSDITSLSGLSTPLSVAQGGTGGTTAPMFYADARFKVGSFSKDISDATASQAITGIGFQPKAIIFNGGVSPGPGYITFNGFSDVTTNRCMFINASSQYDPDRGYALTFISGANERNAVVASFDADGFTLTWSKTNSPTGTAVINYIAYR